MAVFREDEIPRSLDGQILRDGGISLYKDRAFLEEDLRWLLDHGYHIYRLNCAEWTSEEIMHASLAREFAFPDYYGRNLNALDDCLTDLAVPDEGGTAVVLDSYGPFVHGIGGDRLRRAQPRDRSARHFCRSFQVLSTHWTALYHAGPVRRSTLAIWAARVCWRILEQTRAAGQEQRSLAPTVQPVASAISYRRAWLSWRCGVFVEDAGRPFRADGRTVRGRKAGAALAMWNPSGSFDSAPAALRSG